MLKRRKWIILLACGILALALGWAFLPQREPSFQGRTLSELVNQITQSDWTTSGWQVSDAELRAKEQAKTAIRAIGSNALPLTLKWIRHEPSSFQRQVVTFVENRFPPRISRYFTNADHRAAQAVAVFEALGADARPAIPELTRLALTSSGPLRADRCIIALSYIGPDALPSILMLVTNSPPHARWSAVSELRYVPNPEAAVPVLIQCLDDKDSLLAKIAAETLSGILGRCAVIQDFTNAMRTLSSQGRVRAIESIYLAAPTPIDAADALVPYLTDPDLSVRQASTNAMRSMSLKVLNNVPPQ